MELQLLLVLLIAFVILGPEKMMDLAVKLGEMMRKVRETWDELRMQAYMEEINRKVMKEEGYNEDYLEMEEKEEDEHREQPTPDDATDRTPEGTQDKAD